MKEIALENSHPQAIVRRRRWAKLWAQDVDDTEGLAVLIVGQGRIGRNPLGSPLSYPHPPSAVGVTATL